VILDWSISTLILFQIAWKITSHLVKYDNWFFMKTNQSKLYCSVIQVELVEYAVAGYESPSSYAHFLIQSHANFLYPLN